MTAHSTSTTGSSSSSSLPARPRQPPDYQGQGYDHQAAVQVDYTFYETNQPQQPPLPSPKTKATTRHP
jgi:hypothetical protein